MEFKDIVAKLQKPDTLAEGLTDLNDWKTSNDAELKALKDKEAESDKRIRDLQDSNMKMYLRITGNQEEKQDDDHEPTADEMIAKIKEEVKGNDNQ